MENENTTGRLTENEIEYEEVPISFEWVLSRSAIILILMGVICKLFGLEMLFEYNHLGLALGSALLAYEAIMWVFDYLGAWFEDRRTSTEYGSYPKYDWEEKKE